MHGSCAASSLTKGRYAALGSVTAYKAASLSCTSIFAIRDGRPREARAKAARAEKEEKGLPKKRSLRSARRASTMAKASS